MSSRMHPNSLLSNPMKQEPILPAAFINHSTSTLKVSRSRYEISVCRLLMHIQRLLMAIQRLLMAIQRLQTDNSPILKKHFLQA